MVSLLHFFLIPIGLFLTVNAVSREKRVDNTTVYVSAVDEAMTIRRIAVLPASDNVGGIYARPIERKIIEIIKSDHHWDYVESNYTGQVVSPEELEEDRTKSSKIGSKIWSDAFIVAKASKGPNGLTIKLDLFLNKGGAPVAIEELKDYPRFSIVELNEQTQILLSKALRRIPYNGLVLSRHGNRITLNLGKRDGLKSGEILSVTQIIKVNRHPKFHFIISSEKEVLGKIKILKADDTLSFATVITEKEKGAIRKYSKISGLNFVEYPDTDTFSTHAASKESLSQRLDGRTSFGDHPEAWLPHKPPTFGTVGMQLGVGTYDGKMALDASGSLKTEENLKVKANVYPSLNLWSELWLNPKWLLRVTIRQAIISADNPLSGSAPDELNHSLTAYSLRIGYNFLIDDDFFGPKVTLLGGFASYVMFVDDTAPQSLTTMEYSGLSVGIRGSFPLSKQKLWWLGVELNILLAPTLTERPVTSGDKSSNRINDFGIFAEKKLKENLRWVSSLNFELYTTSFEGTGSRTNGTATSSSQRHTSLNSGIRYLF